MQNSASIRFGLSPAVENPEVESKSTDDRSTWVPASDAGFVALSPSRVPQSRSRTFDRPTDQADKCSMPRSQDTCIMDDRAIPHLSSGGHPIPKREGEWFCTGLDRIDSQ